MIFRKTYGIWFIFSGDCVACDVAPKDYTDKNIKDYLKDTCLNKLDSGSVRLFDFLPISDLNKIYNDIKVSFSKGVTDKVFYVMGDNDKRFYYVINDNETVSVYTLNKEKGMLEGYCNPIKLDTLECFDSVRMHVNNTIKDSIKKFYSDDNVKESIDLNNYYLLVKLGLREDLLKWKKIHCGEVTFQ